MAQIYKPQARRQTPQKLTAQQVVGLDHQGRGVVRTSQGVRFVPQALLGETVDIALQSKHDAQLIQITQVSPNRVEPPCRYYQQCGGCDLQHLDLQQQRLHKQRTVQQMLQKFAAMDAETWLPPLVGDAWHYRRRARLAVHYDRKRQHLKLGFRAPKSKQITVIDQCLTLAERLNVLLLPLQQMLLKTALVRDLGHVELLEFEPQPVVLLRLGAALNASDRSLLEQFANAEQVAIWLAYENNVQPLIAGTPLPRYASLGVTLACQPTDFVQSHRQMSTMMVEQALEWLAVQPHEAILELYAGSGNFTIPLAQAGAQVTAVEGVASMVTQLQRNAESHGVALQAVCSNIDEPWPRQGWGSAEYQKALLDPARAGAAHAVSEIAQRQIARVVYVSCAPDTLARDAALFKAKGYRLKQAQVIDMFPQTHHIEVITQFERE